MNEFKMYIIRIIVVSAIVQFGVIVSGEKYKTTFSLIGAIFIVFSLITIPLPDMIDFQFDNYADTNFESATIVDKFTESVAEKIHEEIMKIFEVETIVSVKTDNTYSGLYINIECECSDEIEYQIKEYVLKTFCTPNDEVVVING